MCEKNNLCHFIFSIFSDPFARISLNPNSRPPNNALSPLKGPIDRLWFLIKIMFSLLWAALPARELRNINDSSHVAHNSLCARTSSQQFYLSRHWAQQPPPSQPAQQLLHTTESAMTSDGRLTSIQARNHWWSLKNHHFSQSTATAEIHSWELGCCQKTEQQPAQLLSCCIFDAPLALSSMPLA